MTVQILVGDAIDQLRTLADASVHTCVTSPPYWGLRDYGVEGQIGLERTPEEYVEKIVGVFREVRRVLRDDGTLWVNLGDSYAGSGPSGASYQSKTTREREAKTTDGNFRLSKRLGQRGLTYAKKKPIPPPGLKPKDLVGIPWRVAFALQADGWYLRSDIIWSKPNPMPESVTDRPTKAHEYMFLFSVSPRYYYDAAAISERADEARWDPGTDGLGGDDRKTGRSTRRFRKELPETQAKLGAKRDAARSGNKVRRLADGTAGDRPADHLGRGVPWEGITRNKRTVWTVTTAPYRDAHFATFPPKLIEPCILAGCPVGGTVLDPFGGAGTTGLVADRLGRNAVLIELNPAYAAMAKERIHSDAPLFAGELEA